jgi:hypothetical protein
LEIKTVFFTEIYGYLANDFDKGDMRRDDLLLCALKTLKMLYLFAQNKLQSPNCYLVLSVPAASVYISCQGSMANDLTDGMTVALWYFRESKNTAYDGKENIYEIINPKGQGFSVKYDRASSHLEFNIHNADGTRLTLNLSKVASKSWHYVTVTQSYTKCRIGSPRGKKSKSGSFS